MALPIIPRFATRSPPVRGPWRTGKIERWHQTLKNRILLKNHYLPGDLGTSIGAFVKLYSHRRHGESLGNFTPAGVCFGRDRAIVDIRRRIKDLTIRKRR